MNILQILQDISKADPEIYDRLDSRRAAMRQFSSLGKKVALAAVPMAFGTMIQKAYGGVNETALQVLNYALTLEHLEADFYNRAVAANNAANATGLAALTKIRDDERAHVAFLTSAIRAAGGTPAAANTNGYDFTGSLGGSRPALFPNPFASDGYGTLLAIAQALEDTGVRAYKGRAAEIKGTDYLTVALQIHSVEARHAAHIRSMRRALTGGSEPKSWVQGATGGTNGSLPAETDAVYGIGAAFELQPITNFPAETNTMQGGVETKGLGNGFNSQVEGIAAAAESFDEALDKATVLAIAGNFITP